MPINITKEELTQMIATEVTKQLQPFNGFMHSIKSRMDALFNNGENGQPPGYLNERKKIDDERWKTQTKINNEVSEFFVAKNAAEKAKTFWLKRIGIIVTIVGGLISIYYAVKTGMHVHNSLVSHHSEVYNASRSQTSDSDPDRLVSSNPLR